MEIVYYDTSNNLIKGCWHRLWNTDLTKSPCRGTARYRTLAGASGGRVCFSVVARVPDVFGAGDERCKRDGDKRDDEEKP